MALSSPIHRSISETLGKAVDMYGSEAEPVEWNRASCAEGSWVIVKEVGDAALTYPRYLVSAGALIGGVPEGIDPWVFLTPSG